LYVSFYARHPLYGHGQPTTCTTVKEHPPVRHLRFTKKGLQSRSATASPTSYKVYQKRLQSRRATANLTSYKVYQKRLQSRSVTASPTSYKVYQKRLQSIRATASLLITQLVYEVPTPTCVTFSRHTSSDYPATTHPSRLANQKTFSSSSIVFQSIPSYSHAPYILSVHQTPATCKFSDGTTTLQSISAYTHSLIKLPQPTEYVHHHSPHIAEHPCLHPRVHQTPATCKISDDTTTLQSIFAYTHSLIKLPQPTEYVHNHSPHIAKHPCLHPRVHQTPATCKISDDTTTLQSIFAYTHSLIKLPQPTEYVHNHSPHVAEHPNLRIFR